MMNKYRGPNDQSFLLVADRIKTYSLEAREKLASRGSSRQSFSSDTQSKLMNVYSQAETHETTVWQPSQIQLDCHRNFRTSDYESHKERVPDRVDGTCRWVLEHPHFDYWWKSESSKLLWVSADPGCGKSVLAKSLIARELKSTEGHTTCYFFFKDDNAEQTSATNAVCALLHQLFNQKKFLINHAMSDFRQNGVRLQGLFERLWSILKAAAADTEAGTIICVIDALDECEESSRTRLLTYLDHFYNNITGNDRKSVRLKFLVTSRPYFHIERDLQNLISKYPVIRLAGEAETQSISREINLVIKVETEKLGLALKLDDSTQSILQNELCKYNNRTYLWLHLVMEVIRRSLETMSQKQIQNILSSVPDTVDKAYSAILERSEDKDRAKKLLRLILSASRPLTLRETNVAMTIEASSASYDDLDIVSEDKWKVIIRNLCGLFVTVVDSRVYLIHQTAREFLLSHSEPGISKLDRAHSQQWKHSVTLKESHFTAAQICIWYLLFAVFDAEGLKLRTGGSEETINAPLESDILGYLSEHIFLSYAAEHWAFHFRESQDEADMDLLRAVTLKICNTRSSRFVNWFPIYWTRAQKYTSFSPFGTNSGINSMMVACHLGLGPVVSLLLQQGAEVDGIFCRMLTPLSWTAEAGHVSVARLLLDRCARPSVMSRGRGMWRAQATTYRKRVKSIIGLGSSQARKNDSLRPALPTAELSSDSRTQGKVFKQTLNINMLNCWGETSLMIAAMNGHKNIVELLIEKNAKLDLRDSRKQETAIEKAARSGHEEVVMLLLEKTPRAKHPSKDFASVLINAAHCGHTAVVKIMLDRGINIECRDKQGRTALSGAAEVGHLHVVELLLDHGADIETKDGNECTPLMHAVIRGRDSVVAKFLQCHANVEAKNEAGQTATSLAVNKAMGTTRWGVLGLLLEHGAILKTTHDENITILMDAARGGEIGVLRFFLEKKNLSIESKRDIQAVDRLRMIPCTYTPLLCAAFNGRDATVEFLLEQNANIEAKDCDGNTSLTYAAVAGSITVIRILLENGAEIDSRNIRAETPLLMAVRVGAAFDESDRDREARLADVVENLLAHGANADVKANDGMTPLLWAVAERRALVIRSLLEHNVRTDYKDQNGRTALELAEYLGEKKIVALLLRLDPQNSSVLDWTRTPLSEAAEKGHETVVKQYLDEDNDIEAKDGIFAQSPLVWAAENGHEGVVRLLLEHGAQIESTNKYRQTALTLGVRNNHCRVVKLLLGWNANVEPKDITSRTPLMMTNSRDHASMQYILENHTKFRNNLSTDRS